MQPIPLDGQANEVEVVVLPGRVSIFSAAAVEGFAAFAPGETVWLEWETPGQDGYASRATRFWRRDAEPVDRPSHPDAGAAYRSTLTLSLDDEG